MVQRPDAPRSALPRRAGPRRRRCSARSARPLDADDAPRLGLVTFAPDDIDWDDEVRIAIEERAALLARRAHRHGGEPALRRPGDAWRPRSSAASRPGRTGSSSGPTRSASEGALTLYGSRRAARSSTGRTSLSDGMAIDYSEQIPNNVNLAERPARCSARSSSGSRTSSTGGTTWARTASQDDDVYLRTAISVDAERLGALRLREDARLPLGHLPRRAASPTARSASATTWASRSGRRCRASTATTLRRLIVTQGDTEPASVEQQRHPRPAPRPSLYDLRNLFQVNVEEGRHLWAMVYLLHSLLRPRRPRGGRGAAASAAPATPTSRASSAPSTSRRPTGSRFFMFTLLHRPRRQVPARRARRERLRSARAHLPLHADRGGAPHVRRRDRRRARRRSAPAS